jgi:hypothetical protein
MTLFGCFPVCMTFAGIAILALIVLGFGLANRIPGDDQPDAADGPGPALAGQTGPPPGWVMVLMVAVIAVMMLVLAWYWPE